MSRRSFLTALVVGIVVLMTVAGLVLAIFSAGGSGRLALGGRIALVEVEGVIADDEGFLEDVRHLRDDRSVRGWVVAINSPGGVVAPSQSMFRTLQQVRRDDGVPVVASLGAVGASGGYYVALGADSIVALPGTMTGSIGVLLEYPDISGLLDRVGVRMEVVKGGDQKDLGSPFRAMDPEDREILSALVADVHEQFIEVVSEARDLPLEDVRVLADGRVLTGRQAQAVGLVDRLGNLEEAIALAGAMAGLGPEPRLARPPSRDRDWLMRALFGETTVRAVRRLATSLPATGAYPALKYIVR